MTVPNRIKQVIKTRGLKITEFAKICGIPYSTVQNYIRGDIKLGYDAIVKICEPLHINAHWLILGEGQMDLSSTKEPQSPEDIDKVMKELNPEQRQEILSRSMEMKKSNEMDEKVKRLEKCLEELEGKLEGKI